MKNVILALAVLLSASAAFADMTDSVLTSLRQSEPLWTAGEGSYCIERHAGQDLLNDAEGSTLRYVIGEKGIQMLPSGEYYAEHGYGAGKRDQSGAVTLLNYADMGNSMLHLGIRKIKVISETQMTIEVSMYDLKKGKAPQKYIECFYKFNRK